MTTQMWLQIGLWITITTVDKNNDTDDTKDTDDERATTEKAATPYCQSAICALKCWKCVATDCERDPADNDKASPVTCASGQQCVKVRYRMFDNTTHYDSVIRTCTSGPCKPTSEEEFRKCIRTHKHYMISGCSLWSCCDDRDLCNSAHATAFSWSFGLVVLLLCVYTGYGIRTT